MELTFTGTGSAFNTSLGNTSAYLIKNHGMLLIDCGGTVFHQLMANHLLQDLTSLDIIITHPHPDHVGSLGDTIFYAYFILKITPKVYYPDQQWMASLLRLLGVEPHMYCLCEQNVTPIDHLDLTLEFTTVKHLPTVPSYGFLLSCADSALYYSGDANEVPINILEALYEGRIDVVYQDTSGIDYEGTGHLALTRLCETIAPAYRHQVVCMHLDGYVTTEEIIAMGFQVAQVAISN